MQIGTRITYTEEISLWDVDLLQISVYHGMKNNLERMKDCVNECRRRGIRYVIHPVLYSLFNDKMFQDIKIMAEWADLSIILHDEKTPDGGRITGDNKKRFKEMLSELKTVAVVSFENATDTRDVLWFWDEYAESITLDIGHLELAGLDSVAFVKSLSQGIVNRIHYVHMHRNNGWRNGLTDHWFLTPDCREVKALKALLERKQGIGVLLEINETEKTEENLKILRTLRNQFPRVS
jgi:sugar phosphate isomerase/epimerase